ncbi:MAG TPA: dual specificity protein phosphatase family protein [Gemmataceae bacterium]|nr:dual specificity protein phosphatase family protein [Gemmataceae bacterium]
MTGKLIRWSLVAALVGIIIVAPAVYFRCVYDTHKRLRIVHPGRFYRSGQMTADGFADAVDRYHIRTIINVQDEFPDPDLETSFWSGSTVKESQLCRQLGVRYVHLAPTLISRRLIPAYRPRAIDQLLTVLDDEANYPVLLHCHAGLHRTGILTAVYRMEYDGWSAAEAYREMKAQGFGPWVCTCANDYVTQFVLSYRRGLRFPTARPMPD